MKDCSLSRFQFHLFHFVAICWCSRPIHRSISNQSRLIELIFDDLFLFQVIPHGCYLLLDLTIESSLKTCEEVWLGKVFDLQPHTGGVQRSPSTEMEAGSEIAGSDMLPHAVLQQTYDGSR